MTTNKLNPTPMIPVMIEKKPGSYVIPLWDRRPRGLRTIRLLANTAKISTMIMVDLDGRKWYTIFKQDAKE